jgi:hypothetical protein
MEKREEERRCGVYAACEGDYCRVISADIASFR